MEGEDLKLFSDGEGTGSNIFVFQGGQHLNLPKYPLTGHGGGEYLGNGLEGDALPESVVRHGPGMAIVLPPSLNSHHLSISALSYRGGV